MSDNPERIVIGIGHLRIMTDWRGGKVRMIGVSEPNTGQLSDLQCEPVMCGRYRLILEKEEEDKPAVPCWHGPNCDGRWINCHPANSIADGDAPP